MNAPEFIVVDEFGKVVDAVKAALSLPVLNYQYGYARELNETLIQWGQEKIDAAKKYPLIYLMQPFTIKRGSNPDFYGEVNLRWLIINQYNKEAKAKDRMTNNFKTILYPIYRRTLVELINSGVFTSAGNNNLTIEHTVTDRYYWGEDQKSVLTDTVDVLDVNETELKIYNNLNC